MTEGHKNAPRTFIINAVAEMRARPAGVSCKEVLAYMIAKADIVITPSDKRNQEIRYMRTSLSRPTSLIVCQICFHPNPMYLKTRRVVPPRGVFLEVVVDKGGPGRGFNQNGTVGYINPAHHAAARKIGIFKAMGLSTPR
jgi:hypothetical protein